MKHETGFFVGAPPSPPTRLATVHAVIEEAIDSLRDLARRVDRHVFNEGDDPDLTTLRLEVTREERGFVVRVGMETS